MRYRYPLQVLLSIMVLVVGVYGAYRAFRPSGFPFVVQVASARVAVIKPLAGIPLPPALRASDQIDLPALNTVSRMAVTIAINSPGQALPLGHTYDLVFQRPSGVLTVPITSVDISHSTGARIASLSTMCLVGLMCVFALMLLWRGRDRAAAGMGLWVIAWMTGIALEFAPMDGAVGIAVMLSAYLCVVLSRVGFYFMFEAMLEGLFKRRTLLLWRLAFALVCAASLFEVLADNLWFTLSGSAIWLIPAWGSLLGVSYFVPLLMLFVGYHAVNATSRQRLRWMLWSGSLWVLSAVTSDVFTDMAFSWNLLWTAGMVLAGCGFVYAVLRHRVVAVSLVLDRTLVYGGVTALVVGILAALNSVLQHAALGTGASLLLQIVVPLALGIVLSQVRNYAGTFVERMFFRRRYLADKALRRFAHHCGGYETALELLTATTRNVHTTLRSPGVGLYLRKDGQYRLANHEGEVSYPAYVKADDEALAAARAGAKHVDVSELHSALGADGYVFPMGAQAVLVCANRLGEHYASDERKLLAYVARQVGSALNNINVRESLDFVRAVARGTLDPSTTREQALRLESGMAES